MTKTYVNTRMVYPHSQLPILLTMIVFKKLSVLFGWINKISPGAHDWLRGCYRLLGMPTQCSLDQTPLYLHTPSWYISPGYNLWNEVYIYIYIVQAMPSMMCHHVKSFSEFSQWPSIFSCKGEHNGKPADGAVVPYSGDRFGVETWNDLPLLKGLALHCFNKYCVAL